MSLRSYLVGHKLTIYTDQNSLKLLLTLAGDACKLAYRLLRVSGFEFDVVHKVGMKSQAAEAKLEMKSGGTDSTKLDDDLPEMLVSLIAHRVNIHDDHDRTPDSLCIYQRCDDIVGTVNSAQPEVAATFHATTTHMLTNLTPRL